MDSMRSLNTSLPPARRRTQPSAPLLQAFKSAALQVTNLYKAAASDRENAHDEGYQAALEDLLSFMDAENLGVGDGEGWRVRQWATEHLQDGLMGNSVGDSDDEPEEEQRARSSSPAVQRNPDRHQATSMTTSASTNNANPTPAQTNLRSSTTPEPQPEILPSFDGSSVPKADFTFRASQSLPPPSHDLDMANDVDNTDGAEDADSTRPPTSPVQINLRHNRPHHRNSRPSSTRSNHNRESSRAAAAAAAAATAAAMAGLGNLGQGAGSKRRVPFGDVFDIGPGNGNGRDGFGNGGGKRGRWT
ncbi:uncharacterized protein J3D65DRAFT_217755 [Phyllosticta citribraziliensis]|uniref:Uncharacterized protein n=1 Tax=Phyllosticta citribraziliensis TaxID=989973 RepID=A0ABR1M4H2_9PEZI